jgi:hypothetical protein
MGAAAAPAMAQDARATPAYGSTALRSGFDPDPHTISVQSGGSVNIEGKGEDCAGYVASAPDYQVNWTAGSGALPLIFAANSTEDTTLIIRTPDNRWVCNDDGGTGMNPLVKFDRPRSGRYSVWVGTYDSPENYPAELIITELESNLPGNQQPDVSANPTYTTVRLTSGFQPDPHNETVRSGGELNASSVGDECTGFVASAPDVNLEWTAGSGALPLIIKATSEHDVTLVVNGPDGTWFCDDDGGSGTNPLLRFEHPAAGQYNIWVGTYDSSETFESTLSITELDSPDADEPDALPSNSPRPNVGASPTYSTLNLRSGFQPDPRTVSVQSGGSLNARVVGGECLGFIASAPDVNLNWTAGSGVLPLIISADADEDVTLVVNGPDGTWYCDDDGGSGTNAQLRFDNPGAGLYNIWVGTYESADNHQTTLSISEISHK